MAAFPFWRERFQHRNSAKGALTVDGGYGRFQNASPTNAALLGELRKGGEASRDRRSVVRRVSCAIKSKVSNGKPVGRYIFLAERCGKQAMGKKGICGAAAALEEEHRLFLCKPTKKLGRGLEI